MPTNNADIGTLLPQEIIDMILPNLTKRDLAIASRVCTSWLKIFSPVLWQDLKIDSDYTLDRFLSSVMEGALIRNGHYIRTLDTAHYSVIESFATLGRTCTNLTEISVEIKPPPDFGKTLPLTSFIGSAASARGFGATSTAHTTSTLAFGQKQPSTQFGYANAVSAGSSVLPLSRTRTPFNDSHDPETSFARLLLVLQRNKNLKSLRLNGDLVGESRDNHGRGTGFYRILATLPETLESLTFMNVDLGYDFSFGDLLAPTRPPLYHGLKPEVSTLGPLPSLTTLQVSHALNNRSLCSLLSRCPALEALRIAGLERFKIPKVAEILKAECPNLTELFLVPPPRHRPGLKDEELAELLSASRLGWKTLGLGSAMERMNERCSVAKVLESAPTLENLWVEGSGGLLSNDIQFMLSHGPQLKRLLLLNEDRGYGIYDHYISAEDMIRSPWVCGDTLESLKVMIKGVPRPELEKRTNKRPFSEEEKAAFRRGYPRINQGLLYDRLAQLKNLQELVLGVDVESSFSLYVADRGIEGEFSDTNNIQIAFQYDCMEMSLSSGLDRLRDLKNLRRLDLSRMAVKFYEAEEQAWVKKHWPRYGQVEKDDFWTRRKKAMGVYEIYY
ncbi:hypothetical protein BGZ83_007512 [Gryganskiella cystojenkinii]|nr:hypothetical protein BGZ83_007512 [Gryganskiella cystojenkinii]